MVLTRGKAFEILELSYGSAEDEIRSAYKRLALKWHPDKHNNSEIATRKFQEVSSAYKLLTTAEDAIENDFMTLDDMFELFARIFFAARFEAYNGEHVLGSGSSSEEEVTTSDEEEEEEEDILTIFADRLKTKMKARRGKNQTSEFGFRRKLTEEEAKKNADQLIQEEEKINRLREKRRKKKKRQRERRRQEKLKGKENENQGANNAKTKTSDGSSESDDEDYEDSEHMEEITKKLSSSLNSKSSKPISSKSDIKKDTVKKQLVNNNSTESKKPVKTSKKDRSKTDLDSDDGLDPNSAFVAKAAASARKISTQQSATKEKQVKKEKQQSKETPKNDEKDSVEDLDPVVLRSRQIAVRGNEMANLGHYTAAIDLFTQAIKLDPRDFRFFGNRSFCYDRLDQYDKALKDADKAIALAKDWPKGYFRKGRALAGLKLFADAESSFERVLKLDRLCEDAMQELLRCRTRQLMEMGFTRSQSEAAIRRHGTVQQALESLLAGAVLPQESEEIYISDDEDQISKSIEASKTDTKNPEGLTSLWIGNVLPKVTEKDIREAFGKYGQLQSVRMLPEKFCVFVNYKRKDSASKAMEALQGLEMQGQRILIKFPDNPIVNGQPRTTVIKKNHPTSSSIPATSSALPSTIKINQKIVTPANAAVPSSPTSTNTTDVNDSLEPRHKLKGPVNGDECYFWRTTGCAFGDKCHYEHLPESKGIDKKPWHKITKE
ncbi:uncharacterized protein LOC100368918 [Saccoglossus kowalevskii]|uniref:Uncharacterized protein LOC100368918 n=1 Tax=Saccoglossus kowalevskii TaxID=10224 RepID=A0ABM0N130_SACKO|nr:PREDICTED: uncharacterized protein LOC100368918 [Saccoglossus kowalevskii]